MSQSTLPFYGMSIFYDDANWRIKSYFLLLLFLFTGFFGTTASAQTMQAEYADNLLFVKVADKYHENFSSSLDANYVVKRSELSTYFPRLQNIMISHDLRVARAFKADRPTLKSIYLVSFDDANQRSTILSNLEKENIFAYVEKVPLYRHFATPNDPDFPLQWHLSHVNAEQAWDLSTGCGAAVNGCDNEVLLAIVDDAIEINHVDLVGNIWVNPCETLNGMDDDGNGYIDDINGFDLGDGDNDPTPPAGASTGCFSHGTHCAGIAGATTNNATGIAGMGWDVQIMAVKCKPDAHLNVDCSSIPSTYAGVDYAIAAGADIISMSFGGPAYSITWQALINSAPDVVFVAAAGNANSNALMHPASYDNVISVGATDPGDIKAPFSNYGAAVDVMAPGTGIWSTIATPALSDYDYKNGTSMATPMVAGLASVMLCFDNNYSPTMIESCITSTATNIDGLNPGYAGQLGAGVIDAEQAIACLIDVPESDFCADFPETCTGSTITFTDKSIHIPTSWSWTFPGGTPATSTAQNPTVTYAATGVYDVTLETCNAQGCNTLTIPNYVTIADPTATITGGTTTTNLGVPACFTVSFTGSPPWDLTYTDGFTPVTITGNTQNPLDICVTPATTSTFSLVNVATTGCPTGLVSGSATITIDNSCALPNSYHLVYGRELDEGGFSVSSTDDCGWIIGGQTFSVGAGEFDAALIKIDNDGNVQWSNAYGGADGERFYHAIQTADGGYIAVGSSSSYDPGGRTDAWAMKLDAAGNKVWETTLGLSNASENGRTVIELANGDFMICGLHQYEIMLYRLSATGALLAQQRYNYGNNEEVYHMVQNGNDFVIVGDYQETGGAQTREIFLTKIDGNTLGVIWSKRFGGTANENGFDVRNTADGGFILLGSTESYGSGNRDIVLIKTDANGDMQWSKTYGDLANDQGRGTVMPDCNGGYYISGITRSYSPGPDDFIILQVDGMGNLQNSWTYGGEDPDILNDMIQTSDCGLAIVGSSRSFSTGDDEMLFIKLDSNLALDCNLTAVAVTETTPALPFTNFSPNLINANLGNRTTNYVCTPFPPYPSEDLCNPCKAPAADYEFIQNLMYFYFIDQSSNNPTDFFWDFGDGSTDTLQNPFYEYGAPGTYNVTLIASNACGVDTITRTIDVVDIPYCQYTIQPNSVNGKDARIFSRPDALTSNAGDYAMMLGVSWTWSGVSGHMRSLMEIDFNICDENNLLEAEMSFYYHPNWGADHQGANAVWLERITAPWGEYAVTWNTQPPTTTVNRVNLPNTAGTTTDYTDFVVTPLIQDIIANGNNGIMMKLQTEARYRSVFYGSSDYADPNKRPKLELELVPLEDQDTNVTPDTEICLGGSSQLSASGGVRYVWRPDNTLSCNTCPNPVATPTETTTYQVAVFNCENCVVIHEVTVNVNRVEANADTLICEGDAVQLNAMNGGTVFTWTPTTGLDNPNIANPIATPTETTTYVVNASDPVSGCMSSDTVTISVAPLPFPIPMEMEAAICEGTTTEVPLNDFYSIPDYYYEWSPATGLDDPNIANPIATVSVPTTYYVTITSPDGCTHEQSIDVVISTIETDLDLGPDLTICNGESVTLDATLPEAISYTWTPSTDLSCTTCPNPVATPTIDMEYSVLLTDQYGCEAMDTISIVVDDFVLANESVDQTALCDNGAITLQVNAYETDGVTPYAGPAAIEWYNGDPLNGGTFVGTANLIDSATGLYELVETVTYTGDNCAADVRNYVAFLNDAGNDFCDKVGAATMVVTIYPELNASSIVVVGDQTCGPTLDVECGNYVVTNDADGNGANPDYGLISGVGTITFTVTNPDAAADGVGNTCVAETYTANYICCIADPGLLSGDTQLCPDDPIILTTDDINGNPTHQVDPDYVHAYLLVDANGMIIDMQTNTTPNECNFSAVPGDYVVCSYNESSIDMPIPSPLTTPNLPVSGIGSTYGGCFERSCVSINVPEPLVVTCDHSIDQGSGGTNPFQYNTHEICFEGGTQPYSYEWDAIGYVRQSVLSPGHIQIIHADNATWGVSVTDAHGCTLDVNGNPLEFSSLNNPEVLAIYDHDVEPAIMGNFCSNGEVVVFAHGGDGNYNFEWAGPRAWTPPALGPGNMSHGGLTNNGHHLTDLPMGWYGVTVTDNSGQHTVGWYWVNCEKTGGRGKQLSNVGTINTYPNPFDSEVVIEYTLTEDAEVSLSLFDMAGRQVEVLVPEQAQQAGTYSPVWASGDLPTGVYYYQIKINGEQFGGKLIKY